ncbi:helix-turn-helix transcriptional regulator [Mycobacterium sp. smrl_JER01]|uniref:helix-turn-helix transcriptional regulator n=1 Tax=Mycobacterium sp. smrl_JER01 TaxID=3402633 RepID=UPI00006C476F
MTPTDTRRGRAPRPLTEGQRKVLIAFARAGFAEGEWVRPMDVGGRDRSGHSRLLTQLERRGLVESRTRSTGKRGSKLYRLTAAGRRHADEELHESRRPRQGSPPIASARQSPLLASTS